MGPYALPPPLVPGPPPVAGCSLRSPPTSPGVPPRAPVWHPRWARFPGPHGVFRGAASPGGVPQDALAEQGLHRVQEREARWATSVGLWWRWCGRAGLGSAELGGDEVGERVPSWRFPWSLVARWVRFRRPLRRERAVERAERVGFGTDHFEEGPKRSRGGARRGGRPGPRRRRTPGGGRDHPDQALVGYLARVEDQVLL